MQCRVDDCDREAAYKGKRLCQMHYFRVMRNGTTEKKKTRSRNGTYRYRDSRGYFFLYKPDHPLSDNAGNVWEHRYQYHEANAGKLPPCELCGVDIDWSTVHIDHIDNNKSNNDLSNLRALCRGCNVFRDRPLDSGCKHIFTVGDLSMSAHAWTKMPGVKVSGNTIIRRRKDLGWSDEDCIYKERQTHHNTKTKEADHKYFEMRLEEALCRELEKQVA